MKYNRKKATVEAIQREVGEIVEDFIDRLRKLLDKLGGYEITYVKWTNTDNSITVQLSGSDEIYVIPELSWLVFDDSDASIRVYNDFDFNREFQAQ